VGLHRRGNLALCTHLENGKKGRALELTNQEELDAIANGNAVRREDAPKSEQVRWQRYIGDTLGACLSSVWSNCGESDFLAS
jgi:hypothetical protein